LSAIGLVGPDEPRYAWIARDMAETGDWVTPRLYGRPWLEKPPLLYWGGAVFFKLLGEGHPEVAARLPSAICALLATLALAWLAWRTYGEECARWLLLLLPTSVGMIGFSHACATDMPFAGMLTISMVCASVVLGLTRASEDTPILPNTPWAAVLLFGFFLGLAVLAKGPAAIILSGGTLFLWAAFRKRWRDALRLLHPAAIASFCVTALPWYILCAHRNPDFFRVFIIEHNFKRFLTPEFQHVQPFWYYTPVLLVAFLPWTAALLYSAAVGASSAFKSRTLNPVTALILCWLVIPLAFFSLSRSKLPGYILPSIPPIAVLMVRLVSRLGPERRKKIGAVFLLFTVLCIAAAEVIDRTTHNAPWTIVALRMLLVIFLGLIVITNAVLAISFFLPGRSWVRNLGVSLASVPILLSLVALHPQRFLRAFPGLSAQVIASHLRINGFSTYDLSADKSLPRGLKYGLNFYLRREVREWDEKRRDTVYLLSQAPRCQDLRSGGYSCSYIELGLEANGWFLCRVKRADSLGGLGSGGQPEQEK